MGTATVWRALVVWPHCANPLGFAVEVTPAYCHALTEAQPQPRNPLTLTPLPKQTVRILSPVAGERVTKLDIWGVNGVKT